MGAARPTGVRAAPTIDVVYPVRDGDNEELRYSLRSLANIDHGTVWLSGACPAWVRNVGRIDGRSDSSNRRVRAAFNLLAACEHPDVSDPFVLFDDDFFALAPAAVPAWHRGSLAEWLAEIHHDNEYVRAMRACLELLRSFGHRDPASWELHVPMVVYKQAFAGAIRLAVDHAPGQQRTIYANCCGVEGRQHDDVKVYGRDPHDIAEPFLSTLDHDFNRGWIGQWVRAQFPDESPYEQPGSAPMPISNGVWIDARTGQVVEHEPEEGTLLCPPGAERTPDIDAAIEAAKAAAPAPAPEPAKVERAVAPKATEKRSKRTRKS